MRFLDFTRLYSLKKNRQFSFDVGHFLGNNEFRGHPAFFGIGGDRAVEIIKSNVYSWFCHGLSAFVTCFRASFVCRVFVMHCHRLSQFVLIINLAASKLWKLV